LKPIGKDDEGSEIVNAAVWTPDEKDTFIRLLKQHGKNF